MKADQKLADKLRQQKTNLDDSPHLIVEARAGTGKTTTLIEGLKRLKRADSWIVPSSQQQAVFDAMELSKDKVQSICFVAFNKSIATELQKRIPKGCEAMTMHSMGFRAVQRRFGRLRVDTYRVQDIISELLGKDTHEIRRRDFELLKATEKLVNLCKMNLVGLFYTGSQAIERTNMQEQLADLASHYDVDLNGNSARVFDLVPQVLERCKDVERDDCIDFADMIWLPIVLDLPVYRYDLLLVDEAQDLNRCQQALALKAGHRLILVGDPKQAIYGFAGADSESMTRMHQILSVQTIETDYAPGSQEGAELNRSGRGCQILPLTVTRRCGRAIVKEAQKIVPDFEAHESCGKGSVLRADIEEKGTKYPPMNPPEGIHTTGQCYCHIVQPGDMILCRVNAPLVSECFKFLKADRKANIQGRDVGQGLVSTIKKLMKAAHSAHDWDGSVTLLRSFLSDWIGRESGKESRKRNPSETRLIALKDRYDCLLCFCEDQLTVQSVIERIEAVFTDDKNGVGIKLSSIHKAKGLEAKRVFLLRPEGATIPHPMAKSAWQREQEMNLLYVAITRAIEELVYVS